MYEFVLLKGPKFSLNDLKKVKDFQYLEEILNLYVHKYVMGNTIHSFYLEYKGMEGGMPVVLSYIKDSKFGDYYRVRDYISSPNLAYTCVINTMIKRQCTFADLWRGLYQNLINQGNNISELQSVNLLFSDHKINLYIVYDYLIKINRNNIKTYNIFDFDVSIGGNQL